MIWNFHLLVELQMHQTIELDQRYESSQLLLASLTLFTLLKVKGEFISVITGELYLHLVCCFYVECVFECDKNCLG